MELIQTLDQMQHIGVLPAVTFLILLLVAIRSTYEFCIWAWGVLNKWHENKEHKESTEELVDIVNTHNKEQDDRIEKITQATIANGERITAIESKISKLDEIQQQLQSMIDKLNLDEEEERKYKVAQCRSTLYGLYEESKHRLYMDNISREVFSDLKDIYLESGGNSYFKKTVIPYVQSLPVLGIDIFNTSDAEHWCQLHGVTCGD